MFIKKKCISRRTVLRGLGATVALPLLDAMVPALTPLSSTEANSKLRFIAVEMVHGAAGSTAYGRSKNYFSPAQAGADFEFTSTLKSLEPFRKYVTVISNTELHNAMSLAADENGPMADHARSSAVFLTAAHPKRTEANDISSGPSIDQLYAQAIGRKTRIPSIQLCIEDCSMAGGCGYGYSCAYTHAISWASPTEPLAAERSPRAVFNRLFSIRVPPSGEGRANGSRSVLDSVSEAVAGLKARVSAADRGRVDDFMEAIRGVEKRIQQTEKRNSSGLMRTDANAPLSVPDSFQEHVSLMFDLQTLAFTSDITRVSSFKLSVDRCQRVYSESGIDTPFHTLSHHHEEAAEIERYARLNEYHVSRLAPFLKRLQETPDGDGNLLDHAIVLYGSPMGDSHVHAHTFLPLLLVGRANGGLRGNWHLKCPEGTPMANVLLTVAHKLGVEVHRIGDSSGEVDI